jgi:hypothetical protein
MHYYWPKFLTILHHVVFIHCELYDCSFTNILTASTTKHEVKNCNAALCTVQTQWLHAGKDTEKEDIPVKRFFRDLEIFKEEVMVSAGVCWKGKK